MMTTREFRIEGMSCNHCVMSVRKELEKLPGVASNDVRIGAALVSFEESKVSEEKIKAAIKEAGYVVLS
ncbi:MAG: cation transporter [Bacteroidota bacterium]